MSTILDDTGSNSLLETATGLEHQANRLEREATAMRVQAALIRAVLERARMMGTPGDD